MADPEHLARILRGVDEWNRWREENGHQTPELAGADLREADLSGADLRDADLVGANLGGSSLAGADLGWSDLGAADLSGADLTGANLAEADLRRTDLTGACLIGAYLSGTKLALATVQDVAFTRPDTPRANPDHLAALRSGGESWRRWRQDHPDVLPELGVSSGFVAALARAQEAERAGEDTFSGDPDHLAMLRSGVEAWNDWRRANPDVEPDLRGADLTALDLAGVDLQSARLQEARLTRCDLSFARLQFADLSWANLVAADLGNADLTGAMLGGTELVAANLLGADLREADLTRADFFQGDFQHLALLYFDPEEWSRLRSAHPDVVPDLRGVSLMGQRLFDIDFSRVMLAEAHLEGVRWFQGNFAGAQLAYARLSGADLFGTDFSNARLPFADLRESKLNSARFDGAELTAARLDDAELWGASFVGATLHRTRFDNAHLRGADFTRAHLVEASFREARLDGAVMIDADLTDAYLRGASLMRTVLDGASLSGCTVHGVAAWGLDLSRVKDQTNLTITDHGEPVVTVDNLEVAQFVYLMLHNEKIRAVIDTIGQKGVLILGRFTPERKIVLDSLRERLRELGYVPMLFDFDKPQQRDFTETVKTLAGMSRFIIADITNPKSSPLELQATVPDYMVPFVPIQHEAEEPFSMFTDLQHKYDWVLPVLKYDTLDNLIALLDRAVVEPAEILADQLLARKAGRTQVRHISEFQG